MSSPSKHYDKFTYAVKRKSEKDTASPQHLRSIVAADDSHGPLAPLIVGRDGFAVAEDGSLMSRMVSPPRFLHIKSGSQAGSPVSGGAAAASGSSAALPHAVSAAAAFVSPSRSIATPTGSRPVTATGTPDPDPWGTLVRKLGGELTEDELVVLHWDTVFGLLQYCQMSKDPITVAKVQLTWKTKQQSLLGEVRMGADIVAVEAPAAQGGEGTVLVRTAPLTTAPIQVIAYGRPESPRMGGRFVPAHKKPLKWKGEPRVDTGRHRPASSERAASPSQGTA